MGLVIHGSRRGRSLRSSAGVGAPLAASELEQFQNQSKSPVYRLALGSGSLVGTTQMADDGHHRTWRSQQIPAVLSETSLVANGSRGADLLGASNYANDRWKDLGRTSSRSLVFRTVVHEDTGCDASSQHLLPRRNGIRNYSRSLARGQRIQPAAGIGQRQWSCPQSARTARRRANAVAVDESPHNVLAIVKARLAGHSESTPSASSFHWPSRHSNCVLASRGVGTDIGRRSGHDDPAPSPPGLFGMADLRGPVRCRSTHRCRVGLFVG